MRQGILSVKIKIAVMQPLWQSMEDILLTLLEWNIWPLALTI